MSDIPEADQYDTSPIDTHIKEVAKRERSITRGFQIKNFGQMVLWGSLAGLAFALIFILISHGIRLMIYPPPEKEFIERPIPSEITLKLDEPLLVELNEFVWICNYASNVNSHLLNFFLILSSDV